QHSRFCLSEILGLGGSWDRLTQPMMGRVQSYDAIWDLYAMSKYGTIANISESPKQEGLLYAGTDDGLIHVTENGGQSWRQAAALPDVPEFFFVNDIKADLHDANTVYVCVDNHKAGDFKPYVLKSTDRGRSWTSISGDLPDRHIVWRLVQDHENPYLLFVGTEFGVFFTVNAGEQWIKLTGGVPNIPFRDLAIQTRENDLVGATFGRGFYILDDYTPLRYASEEMLEQDLALFPVRDAWWYIQRRTLGFGSKGFQGNNYFAAPNPPFGATFTYYLKDSLKTRKDARTEREKEIAETGGDTPTPGWDALREEELEEAPAVVLTVRDAEGEIVRHITGPTTKGVHRVSWSLTYPSTDAWTPDEGEGPGAEFRVGDPDDGVLVAPGEYTVHLSTRINGQLVDSGRSQRFRVVPLRDGGTLPGASPSDLTDFLRDFDEVQRSVAGARAVLEETRRRLEAIRQTLDRSTLDSGAMGAEARAIERRLADMQQRLSGNERRGMANDPGPVSIARRLNVVQYGTQYALHGPTPSHRESLAIAQRQFDQLSAELNQIVYDEMPELERRLDAAGLPWTPGRGVPGR
ncbi:MAG: glycosyl hydrolase, partial [Planctomycetota bacterium]